MRGWAIGSIVSGMVWASPACAVDLDIGIVVPGDDATFTVSGVAPGERVAFFGSLTGPGAGPCSPLAGTLCLDIRNVRILGTVVADSSGSARRTLTVPASAGVVWLQAVVLRGAASVKTTVRSSLDPVGLQHLGPGDLVITEVMKDPTAVPDTSGEWFEVLNPLPVPVDLQGLHVRDLDTDHFDVTASVVVPAQGYVVIGADADPVSNGGVDVAYAWPSFALANGDDELELSAGGVVFDLIAWDDGVQWPDAAGRSLSLDVASMLASANDDGARWCDGTQDVGHGDLGSPGAVNPSCSTVVPGGCTTGTDRDGDGWFSCDDCDDTDPRIHPGAAEVCDGLDDDCVGGVPAGERDLNADGLPDCDMCATSGYRAATQGLSGTSLVNVLAQRTATQDCDSYTDARDRLFSVLAWDNGFVEGVYTGLVVPVAFGPPDATVMNTEHTWPQSLGTSTNPARCDLHHLYPADANANSRRSNHLFGDVVSVSWTGGGSKLGTDSAGRTVFEPRDVHKGNAARATLYVHARHGLALQSWQLPVLQAWSHLDPVDLDELQRSAIVETWQGVPNPFVICPDLVDRL